MLAKIYGPCGPLLSPQQKMKHVQGLRRSRQTSTVANFLHALSNHANVKTFTKSLASCEDFAHDALILTLDGRVILVYCEWGKVFKILHQ
jgi:anthranilate phosphoribosyltransferase